MRERWTLESVLVGLGRRLGAVCLVLLVMLLLLLLRWWYVLLCARRVGRICVCRLGRRGLRRGAHVLRHEI